MADFSGGIGKENLDYLKKVLYEHRGDYEDDSKYRVGIGLKNISDLIYMTYGSIYGVGIESYEGMGTIVTLRLPIITEEVEKNA